MLKAAFVTGGAGLAYAALFALAGGLDVWSVLKITAVCAVVGAIWYEQMSRRR